MAALMPLADAQQAVLAGAAPLGVESVALDEAFGRVLAHDLAALRNQPPQDMSAMDGYAVRAADVVSVPAKLRIIGEVAAGRPFDGDVGDGQAARIFTGGVIPAGADAVVIQEDTARDGDIVTINEVSPTGKHVRRTGIDFTVGDVLMRAPRVLNDRDLSLAAAMNHPRLPVFRKPRVALLATGDELVMPGSELRSGEIVYSNGFALRALARNEGAEVIDLGIAHDTLNETVAAIRRAREQDVDILVTTGGASVGDHDVVKRALEADGVEIAFWKIAMRPGKPMMHGRRGSLRVLGLPGNPVSSYVCALLFLAPLVRAMSGRTDVMPHVEEAILGRDLIANDQREDYLRATLERRNDGALVAHPVSNQDSSLLAHLSAADALLIRPPFAPEAKIGETCRIVRLRSF